MHAIKVIAEGRFGGKPEIRHASRRTIFVPSNPQRMETRIDRQLFQQGLPGMRSPIPAQTIARTNRHGTCAVQYDRSRQI